MIWLTVLQFFMAPSAETCADLPQIYQGKTEIPHGATITCRNKNDTVGANREQQRGEDKPDSGGDKPRQSNWGVPSGSSHLGGPLIWAAYIHAGL